MPRGLFIPTQPSTARYVRVGVGWGYGADDTLRNIIGCHLETWEVSEKQHSEGAMPRS